MQKTTTIVLIAAFALVAAALIGVTFAQTATPNPTSTPSQTVAPWCINPNKPKSPTAIMAQAPHLTATTTEHMHHNGAVCASGNCYNADAGYCAGTQACNTYGAQGCGQYGYGQQDTNVYQGGRMGQCDAAAKHSLNPLLVSFLFNRRRRVAGEDAFADFWRSGLPSGKACFKFFVG